MPASMVMTTGMSMLARMRSGPMTFGSICTKSTRLARPQAISPPDELGIAQRERLRAHDPRINRDIEDGDDEDDRRQARAEDGHDGQRKQHGRKCPEWIEQQDQGGIEPARAVAGDQSSDKPPISKKNEVTAATQSAMRLPARTREKMSRPS